jgi:hypothetical protein
MDKKQKTPEPTFKSDVDDMVSGVKKFNKKINDTTKPVRKVLEKAAGKEEQGIIGQFTKPDEYSKDNKAEGIDLKALYDSAKKDDMGLPAGSRTYKKGGMVKSSASKRADGIATKGKTRGKIC